MKILKYILAVFFILGSLGVLVSGAILSSFFTLLLGIIFLPPISEKLKDNFSLWRSKGIRYIAYIFLFGISGITSKEMKDFDSEKFVEKKEENIMQEKKASVINYTIVKESVIRFDKAPSFFVLIDKVDLSNNKFKEDIKNLVNKIVTENGAKINIEIIDDKNTLELMYKSHYGVNTLGRILNKSEIGQLEKHLIASFSGELGTDYQAYFNTLYLFPSASKNSPRIGEFVEIIEYNPDTSKIIRESISDKNASNSSKLIKVDGNGKRIN